jgi:hypothetical protein
MKQKEMFEARRNPPLYQSVPAADKKKQDELKNVPPPSSDVKADLEDSFDQADIEQQKGKEVSSKSARDNMDAYNEKYSVAAHGKVSGNGKRKDDKFSEEDSSIYVHGDEYTNAANINSNRHDINFDGIEQISDDDNL